MSDVAQEPMFVLSGLSEPAKAKLEEDFAASGASQYLIRDTTATANRTVHGELVSGTVLVVAGKVALPIFAGWLLSLAPPRKRKETIRMILPDGTKVSKTIEYSKTFSVATLVKL